MPMPCILCHSWHKPSPQIPLFGWDLSFKCGPLSLQEILEFVIWSELQTALVQCVHISTWVHKQCPLQEYLEEEILLRYDVDFKHRQNFVICTKVEAKDQLIKQLVSNWSSCVQPWKKTMHWQLFCLWFTHAKPWFVCGIDPWREGAWGQCFPCMVALDFSLLSQQKVQQNIWCCPL